MTGLMTCVIAMGHIFSASIATDEQTAWQKSVSAFIEPETAVPT
jgi:hypothetical protein